MDSEPRVHRCKGEWDAFLDYWQGKYTLPDLWIREYASATMNTAMAVWNAWGKPHFLPLDLSVAWDTGMHDGKAPNRDAYPTDPFQRYTSTPEIALVDVPVYLDMLKYAGGDAWVVLDKETGDPLGEVADDGLLGTFDPRTETVKEAEARLLDAIRPRLREALERIVASDRVKLGAIDPITYRSPTAFEWLVRYQVLGEDMGDIAASAGVSIQAVSTALHKAKDAIGLTLRERSKPGPKPGSFPNRVR